MFQEEVGFGVELRLLFAPQKGNPDRVLIVEDVITTGGSSKKAIERAGKCGLKVVGLLTLIDRQEGGREVIEAMGLPFKALFTKEEIFEAYKKIKY